MSALKVLPANVANMIAAGEVVQRPASVVKELMENAIDAGASQVSVVVTDAGRTLIQVIDNGCGMCPADAVLCFERHATSKISDAEDLYSLHTFGFRGEALPSIAAVAEVTLKTRRDSDETAVQVRTAEGGKLVTSSTSAPVGSNFAVRNLFYNTPARRKFLKSDNVELKHIIEEFSRVALTRPGTGFSLISNGKEIFVLKPAKSLKFRVLDLMGAGLADDLVDISAETSFLGISGFIGRPDTARKTAANQMFFVNGRYFRSPYLHKAVMNAYSDLMPEGLMPSYFIFMETDASQIDVNVHPTKTEIKFEDDSLVFQTLYACVRETLGRNSFGASIDFDGGGAVQFPQLGKSFEEYRGTDPALHQAIDPDYDPFAKEEPLAPDFSFSRTVDRTENYGALFEEKLTSSPKVLVIKGRYIVTGSASGMMIVNIRRARERVLYERLLKAMGGGEHITQSSMFPVQVHVGADRMLLFEENSALLESVGFDISSFGTDTIVVNGVPEGYSCSEAEVRRMVDDLLLILSEEGSALPELMVQSMAQKFATLGAVNSEAMTSPLEAQRLIDALFSCDNAEFTASGRKIAVIVSTEEIDKKF